MPQELKASQTSFTVLAKVKGRRPVGRPQICWNDYIDNIRWNR